MVTQKCAAEGAIAPDFDSTPVLVWQMGKVGSMSIHAALIAAGLPSVHIHVLNPDTLSARKKKRADAGLPPTLQHQEADRLAPLIRDQALGFRVISAVRDPVARRLSQVFQLWQDFPPDGTVDQSDPIEIARWFVNSVDRDRSSAWFDDEIGSVFDVDIYQRPFDRETRSLRLDTGRMRLLVLRCEDENAIKQTAINHFLGRTEIRLGFDNLGSDKPQGDLYNKVKQVVAFPHEIMEEILSAKMVRHFYDASEIAVMRSRWCA